MKTIAFFNNKGGVGKTSLAYHLAWIYGQLGLRVVAADLDPQANLSAMFLDEARLEELWPDGAHPLTILGVIQPILKGTGDIANPHVENIALADDIGLVPGDLGLSSFEDELSSAWPNCLDGKESAFRIISAFHRALAKASEQAEAHIVLIDVGPNLGAINRAALIAADYVVIPLTPDLFSLQGLRNLGPTMRRWRSEWAERLNKNPEPNLSLPKGLMAPAGYVIQQHAVRFDRPVRAYARWIARIPDLYREAVTGEPAQMGLRSADDPYCLAQLKHYRSLMPMAMEARKPMFLLKPADGAIGAHVAAVQQCYRDFRDLALEIANRCGVPIVMPLPA